MALWPYLLGGALLWFFMLKSGVHATIAGVLLAFAIPYSSTDEDTASPSHRLEGFLHKPVAFLILPVFALANTAIVISETWVQDLMSANSIGIAAGLVIGKPLGVALFCLVAVALKLVQLPSDLRWAHVIGAGMLGGIGFTMSIFITNLAFTESAELVTASKMAILMASLTAGLVGYCWLRFVARPVVTSA
jgi:NhaA family Na+:H+ antiporter